MVFKFKKPLKRIATLTSRKAIENSPHNKKLLDHQNLNQEESRKNSKEKSSETKFNQIWRKNSKEESSKTKFNQNLFSSTPGEVAETLTKSTTSKIEKATKEINETPKEENKEENKEKTKIIKTINAISSKVDKQVFFDVIDKIKEEETQRNYLQNLKNLILMENSNKTQEIKPTEYLILNKWNF